MKFFTSEAQMPPGSPRERHVILAAAAFALFLAVLDQATKILVLRNIGLHERITVIPGFFDLTHVTNKGAAFRFYWRNLEWPSFNVADSAICCGVTLFVISSFFRPENKPEAKKDDTGDAAKSA